ncbi:phosphotransferase family protein [Pseudonocardia sp. GCM10023141]|uniref:phosphotransferase family protein n=1 Tax=Pseudonocardia sp. GCM10023141 TaxID=3252653 RepID=UPI0036105D2C
MSELLTIDEAAVRGMLARAGITAPVERLARRASTVYEAHLGVHDPVIVKLYEPQAAWKQAKEIHVYSLLAGAGTGLAGRIPQVLGHERGTGPNGPACTVLTRLDGTPLHELDPQLTPADRRRIYVQIGQLLRAVHRVPMGGFGYLVTDILDPAPSNQAALHRMFERKLCEFAELGGPADLARAVRRAVADHAPVLAMPVEPVLCHNDLHEGNVLVARAGNVWNVTGFVDVGNAVAADPVFDLAGTDYRAARHHPVKRAGLLEGHGDLPADVEARLRIYSTYHALERWDRLAKTGEQRHLPGIAADLAELTGQ